MNTSKLYVGNINFEATEQQLRELFSACGEIKDTVIIKDKFSERSKGFGFVEFNDPEVAREAIKKLDGEEFQGRQLRVAEAKPKRTKR